MSKNKTEDLTGVFLKAYSFPIQLKKMPEMIKIFAETNGDFIDWDCDDGELWGSILNGNKRVGMFHVTLPIVFVDSSHFNSLDNFLQQAGSKYAIIEVNSWNDKNYLTIRI
ncbi:hypothetical protein [Taibaiella koreensis]|uniref:hypothetical protein n=1 Tax=Taibaiella koreensis TaxID=1268548 RepID=UPI001968CA2C|nr:hypothetical protein [Taibaiella koreensis]